MKGNKSSVRFKKTGLGTVLLSMGSVSVLTGVRALIFLVVIILIYVPTFLWNFMIKSYLFQFNNYKYYGWDTVSTKRLTVSLILGF